MLWERCAIPSLLYGAGTWVEMTTATIKRLNNLQYWFLRLVLQVGKGAPLTSLTWETGCMEMGLRVAIEKVSMVLHIRSLDDDALAKRVYEEQKTKNWPGLAKETAEICKNLNVEDCNETVLSKAEYRKMFIEACKLKDEDTQRKEAKEKIKCERILEDCYGQKEYIRCKSLYEARKMYKTRVGLRPFAGNYSHSNRFKTNLMCKCALKKETESHLLYRKCPIYQDIREKFDSFEDDENLVKFFDEVLTRRDALEGEDAGGEGAADIQLAGDHSGEPLWGSNPS